MYWRRGRCVSHGRGKPVTTRTLKDDKEMLMNELFNMLADVYEKKEESQK
jgi:hypothetical protein